MNIRQEANRRLDICSTCEHHDKEKNKCNKCGCFLAAKVYVKFFHCPIMKW